MPEATTPTAPTPRNLACELIVVESADDLRDIRHHAEQMNAKLDLLFDLFNHHDWAEANLMLEDQKSEPAPASWLTLKEVLRGLLGDAEVVLSPILGRAEAEAERVVEPPERVS